MSLRNSPQAYGLLSRFNHWLTALIFIPLIPMGILLEEMEDDRGDFFFQLMGVHKSLGVFLILLVALRLVWLLLDRTRVAAEQSSQWQALTAKLVRVMLWVGLVAMPISGWIMSNSAGYPVGFFGLFQLPTLVPESELLHEMAEGVHGFLPPLLILSVVLHIAGALKHHWIDGDRTLTRMTRGAGVEA